MSEGSDVSIDDLGTAGVARPIRVLTYNVKGGEGADGRWLGRERDYLALDHVVALIKEHSPDVVCVQEIAVIGSNGHYADQVAYLGRALGMHHAFAPVEGAPLLLSGDGHGRDYWGNAILSRFPIIGLRVHELQEGRPRDSRSLLETQLLVGSQVLNMFSVHLSYIWRTTFAQAREVAAITARAIGPVIVAGDFNAAAGSAELSPLHAVFNDVFSLAGVPLGHSCRYSYPDGLRRHRDLDHIFVSANVRVESCCVAVDEGGASDHNPVLAELWLSSVDAGTAGNSGALADDLSAEGSGS